MVLAGLISELSLQKKVRARYHSPAVKGIQGLTHSGFEVMPPLVSGIDSPEAAADREFG